MTFKEYRKLTRTTSINCLKISGIIFSICFCIIYILTEALSTPFLKNLLMIVICIILGNLFGVYIWLLAILSSFAKVKRLSKLLDELPKNIKDFYDISLLLTTKDEKNNYPDCKVVSFKTNYPFELNCDRYHIYLKLYYTFNSVENLIQNKSEINQKYKKEQIELSGFNFVEKSKRKEWHLMTQDDLEKRIKHLIEISEAEDRQII